MNGKSFSINLFDESNKEAIELYSGKIKAVKDRLPKIEAIIVQTALSLEKVILDAINSIIDEK